MELGERIKRAIEAFRREPEKSLASFKAQPVSTVVVNNFIENVTVKIDNSTTYGTRIEGDVKIKGAVTDAFNTINNIDTSTPEKQQLQYLLKVLHGEAGKLIEAMPEKPLAEKAARHLRNLTEEASAEAPDRSLFDISADGLLAAAKTVASLAGPVTTAVKAVSDFFQN